MRKAEDNKKKMRFWAGIALGHLVLVFLGASYVDLSILGPVGKALGYYSDLSGAGNSYGFFAPGITSQLRAVFDIYDPQGDRKTVSLFRGLNQEADLRVGNIVDQFASIGELENDDEEGIARLQRSMAASLAGTIFARYPRTMKVVVRLEDFAPASMEEYRKGSRPDWKPLYTATFVHEKRKGAE